VTSNEIIIEPVLTEKTNFQREGEIKTYAFKVSRKANKPMVMQALDDLFKVRPMACRIMNVRGKARNNRLISRTTFRRGRGRTSAWKKAIVTLRKGQSIDVFEGV